MPDYAPAWPQDMLLADAPSADVEVDDDELALAAHSDPQTFAVLYRRFVRPVYRYCYVRLGNREAAEDATSTAFLKAFSAIGSYQRGHFAAWLFRIAHNAIVDLQRQTHPQAALDEATELADLAPSPEEAALIVGADENVRSLMAHLTDDRRIVLELHLAGWTDPQAAAIIGKSAMAVKMLRRRALSQLRELLTAQDNHE